MRCCCLGAILTLLWACNGPSVKPTATSDTDLRGQISDLQNSQVEFRQEATTRLEQLTEQISGVKASQGQLSQKVETVQGNLNTTQSQVTSFAIDPQRRQLEEKRIQAERSTLEKVIFFIGVSLLGVVLFVISYQLNHPVAQVVAMALGAAMAMGGAAGFFFWESIR